MIDLTSRVVLVPGANGGIGSHFAECGADVAMTYRAGKIVEEMIRRVALSVSGGLIMS
jgi:NAD(P)-dependent dehydrogenase (short-subunit alcohol dehydrogenase family)